MGDVAEKGTSVFLSESSKKSKIIFPSTHVVFEGIDKKGNKWTNGEKLETLSLNEMPKYIIENCDKYKFWLDSI